MYSLGIPEVHHKTIPKYRIAGGKLWDAKVEQRFRSAVGGPDPTVATKHYDVLVHNFYPLYSHAAVRAPPL